MNNDYNNGTNNSTFSESRQKEEENIKMSVDNSDDVMITTNDNNNFMNNNNLFKRIGIIQDVLLTHAYNLIKEIDHSLQIIEKYDNNLIQLIQKMKETNQKTNNLLKEEEE